MAQEIREFAVTVPPGTTPAAPLVTPIVFPARVVAAVSWRVPPGPAGKLGWALTSAGAWVIPVQPNTYLVTDNQADTWDLEGYLDSGNWAVTAYNAGVFPHTVYLTFLLDLPGSVAPPTPQPTGIGTGVVGLSGAVVTTPVPAPVSSPATPPIIAGDESVVSAVLAMAMAQLQTG